MALAQWMQDEIAKKVHSGQKLDVATPEKQAYYDAYKQRVENQVKEKANSGQTLSDPSGWKKTLYNQTIGKPTTTQPSQTQPKQMTNNQTYNTSSQPAQQTNTPKQYAVQGYNPNAQIDQQYIDQATKERVYAKADELYKGFAGADTQAKNVLSQDNIREIAYYNQMQDQAGQLYHKYMQDEINKGYGLTKGWVNNYPELVEAYRKAWASQDFLQDKYMINGTDNFLVDGLSRADLGFNESGSAQTVDEHQTEEFLMKELGYDAQKAYNMARGMNGSTRFVLQDGQLVDTGEQRAENIYDDLGNREYFNDPRNQGQTFNWMNYINPDALQGQRDYDGANIDYYYNANFARGHGYLNEDESNWDFNAPAPWDWRNLSHEEMIARYGLNGTDRYSAPTNDITNQYMQYLQDRANGYSGNTQINLAKYLQYI